MTMPHRHSSVSTVYNMKTIIFILLMACFLQWNIRGLQANYEELRLLTARYSPKVIALQETKLIKDKKIQLKGYEDFYKYSPSGDPVWGVCLYVNKSCLHSPIDLDTPLQALATRVSGETTLTVCNLYLPPSKPVSRHLLENLIDQLPRPFLLVGDFNAHSPLWGDTRLEDSNRGHIIEDFCGDLNLCILNNGEHTYLHHTGSTSAVDLSICSPSLNLDFEWKLHEDLCGSDHFPIIVGEIADNSDQSERGVWNFKKADWPNFQLSCDLQIIEEEIFSAEDPIVPFTEKLISVAKETIPLKKLNFNNKPRNPWFDEECKAAIKERKKAQRKVFRNPTEENIIAFKRARAKVRYLIKKKKKDSWEKFCSSLSSKTSPAKVWKSIRKIKGKRSSSGVKHLKINGKLVTDRKSISNLLAETISTNSSSDNFPRAFQALKAQKERKNLNFSSDNSEDYNAPFSLIDITHALQKTKNSATGPDDVHYELLKHLPHSTLNILLRLFNRIWDSGVFPPSWREATVVPIPKPGKDHSNPTNYRPIALTSCLCKTMEKMVNERLMWVLEDRGLLAKEQCGFRKNHSTVDHLVRFESFVREAFGRGQEVLAIFFDLEKAYDRTWKHGILSDLFDMDFRGRLPIFIEGFLANRMFKVKVGSTLSDNFEQEMGVPQGSILSPALFSIKINNIVKSVLKGVNASLFVDDFALCIRGKRVSQIQRTLQLCVNKVQKWVSDNGFKFSTTKTVCVHFKKRGKCEKTPIYLGKEEITIADEVRFLGVVFDKHLTFRSHIIQLKVKCQKALDVLRVVGHTDWGADKTTLLRLYRALVRSKLDYGCIVYGSAAKSNLKLLDPIHHQGLRIALGAFRTSPVTSLYAEANEPSLNNRRIKLALNYVLKLKTLPDNPAYNCVFHPPDADLFETASQTPPLGIRILPHLEQSPVNLDTLYKHVLPDTPPWLIPTPNVDLSLTSFKKDKTIPPVYQHAFRELRASYGNMSEIYTDGSKEDERCAAAAVKLGQTDISSCRLRDHSSVYSAELQAIVLALKEVLRSRSETKFLILSDSLSALQALRNTRSTHPLLVQIFKLLGKLSIERKYIVFVWVPGHVGIKGNEAADKAAKQALGSNECLRLKLPFSDFKCAINSYVKSCWQEEWNMETENKLFESLPDLSERLQTVHGRRNETVLTRVHIGHSFLTHGFILRREDPPVCVACDCRLTVKHILLECVDFQETRVNYFNVDSVYTLFQTVPPDIILDYLKEIGFYKKF